MEASQLDDFSEKTLHDACGRWNLTSPKRISEAENLVYACESPTGKVALRLTHPDHRSAKLLEAELAWLDHLTRSHVSVVTPRLSSHSQSFLETIESASSHWFACAFEWIDGGSVVVRNQVVPDNRIREWGELTGSIIKSSLETANAPYRNGRHHWNTAPSGQRSVTEKVRFKLPTLADEIVAQQAALSELPRSSDNYTLIHSDLHHGNVFLNTDRKLVALDFDDSCHHFVLQEFAMPLYYSFFSTTEDLEEAAKHYFTNFLTGYRKFHDIPLNDFEQLPVFFRLRDLDLMAICHLWNIPPEHAWSKDVSRIYKNGNPLSKLPWKKWAKSV